MTNSLGPRLSLGLILNQCEVLQNFCRSPIPQTNFGSTVHTTGSKKAIDSNNILLSYAEDGKSVLHGVTSWGLGCAIPTFPGGVYANVFAMTNFVTNIIVRSNKFSFFEKATKICSIFLIF